MLVPSDLRTWQAVSAPWSPRGGVAGWTNGTALFITGGKFSIERNGEHQFIFSSDVWRMQPLAARQ